MNTARREYDTKAALAGRRGVNVEVAATINRSAEELYPFWRDFENLPQSFTQRTATMGVLWKPARGVRWRLDYDWERWTRENRDADQTDEHVIRTALDYEPSPMAVLRLYFRHADRQPNAYVSVPLEYDRLRRFDQAARLQNEGSVALVEWGDVVASHLPADRLEVRLTAGAGDYDIPVVVLTRLGVDVVHSGQLEVHTSGHARQGILASP